MVFVIKHSNMYFKKINDHSSMMGYLNRHHPVYTFKFFKARMDFVEEF